MHTALSSLPLFLVKLELNPDRMIFMDGFNGFTEHHFHEFEATATQIGAHKTSSPVAKQNVRSLRLCGISEERCKHRRGRVGEAKSSHGPRARRKTSLYSARLSRHSQYTVVWAAHIGLTIAIVDT